MTINELLQLKRLLNKYDNVYTSEVDELILDVQDKIDGFDNEEEVEGPIDELL